MPALKTYDLFISHPWTRTDEYDRLVGMLNAAPNFYWRNYSVPQADPLERGSAQKLMDGLKRQISSANAILVLAGMYVNYRDWIQAEIDLAASFATSKPIIGIRPWGSQVTPTAVTNVAATVVGWNTDSIIQAIRDHSL